MKRLDDAITVKVVPVTNGGPAGKLADLELHFTAGALAGMRLMGFSLWAGRDERGPHVSLPSRQYTVDGERRSFTLLRPSGDEPTHDALRETLRGLCADLVTAAE